LEISQPNPPAEAGRSFDDLVAALAEAISAFVARMAEPCPTESYGQRAASPPNLDYF
jgi:hypothetical protein